MIRRFLTLGVGEAVTRALYLLAFVAIARGLGKAALGQFGFALSVTSYLVLAVQQGFDQIAVRAIARDGELLETYVRAVFGLRLIIAAALYSLLAIYTHFRMVPPPESPLLLILGLTCFTTASAPRWAFQVLSPRQFATANVLSQLVFCGGAFAVFQGSAGLYTCAASYAMGDALAAAYLLRALRLRCRALPTWAPRFWRSLTRESAPVSLSAVLGIIVYNFDILALGWLAAPADVGLYLACYRCATVFSPLISILQLSILPTFASAYSDRRSLRRGIRAAAVPTVLAAAAVAIIFSTFPALLLRLVYGSGYSGGAVILSILAWSLPVQALRSILRQVLLAGHFERLDTVNMSLAAMTSIVIDIALIPRLGPVACAISTLCSETVLLAASAATLKRKVLP